MLQACDNFDNGLIKIDLFHHDVFHEMHTILYGNMQWWTVAEFDVASIFLKKQRHIAKRAKVNGNAREID